MTREYVDLVNHILQYGTEQSCRNGSQLIIPNYSFTLDFSQGIDSAKLKLRKMWYKGVEGEFKTLISSEPLTNVSQFEANGCNYWKDWADEDGSLNLDYYNELHPAIENVIGQIKADPESRRHVISLWNNEHAFDGSLSLHCCWHNLTFSVIAGVLHLNWTQRSVDTMIGLPADIYLAYLFMEHIAKQTNLTVGTCMFSLSNVHIYSEHIEGAKQLLDRATVLDEDIDSNYFANEPIKFELKA